MVVMPLNALVRSPESRADGVERRKPAGPKRNVSGRQRTTSRNPMPSAPRCPDDPRADEEIEGEIVDPSCQQHLRRLEQSGNRGEAVETASALDNRQDQRT